jgi:DNA-binding NarL/FixJ family response regulator
VSEAGDGAEAVALTKKLDPDVVLMDIQMPGMNGLDATREIKTLGREESSRVLILTTFELDEYVYEALRAGASGFLLKRTPAEDLIAGIRVVHGDALLASVTKG